MSYEKKLFKSVKEILGVAVTEWLERNRNEIIAAIASGAVLREREERKKQV
jgi:hypothetical protein